MPVVLVDYNIILWEVKFITVTLFIIKNLLNFITT